MNRLSTFLIVVALLLGSSAALADTSYPGYACLTKNESLSRIGSRYESSDLLFSLNVACPVVRTNLAVGVAVGSRAFVFDQHTTANVSCTLSAKGPDGFLFGFSTQATTGSSAAVKILTFGALGGFADGHYTLYCSVPPEDAGARSSIASYLIKN